MTSKHMINGLIAIIGLLVPCSLDSSALSAASALRPVRVGRGGIAFRSVDINQSMQSEGPETA